MLGRRTVAMTLSAALALGCSTGAAPGSKGEVRYSYVVTPSGRVFRVFGAGPVVRGANSTHGVRVSYLAQSRHPADLERDAEELVRAFGPEMLLTPEKLLAVQARHGTARKDLRQQHRDLLFQRADDSWTRKSSSAVAAKPPAPPDPAEPKPLGDESSFPFRPAELERAAHAAAQWLRLLDAGDLVAAFDGMSREFREKVEVDPERWAAIVAARVRLGLAFDRSELYRMLSRGKDRQAAEGGSALVQYETDSSQAGRILERVIMVREDGAWRVTGYVYEPIPAS